MENVMTNSGKTPEAVAGPLEVSIEKRLRETFEPVFLEIGNESKRHHGPPGAESHFKVQMVSKIFEGIKSLDRQRLVNELLSGELKGPIHALTMKLYSPSEWEALSPEQKKFRAIGHTKGASAKS
jgi:BolA protein